jgi:hypothetical protein
MSFKYGFEYLVFTNNAKEPIAGFMFPDHAAKWAEENFPNAHLVKYNDEDFGPDNRFDLGGFECNEKQEVER